MNSILLDTDVFSYLLRPGDTRGDFFRPLVADKSIAISFVSVGELYAWSYMRGWGKPRISRLDETLESAIIIPFDLDLCKEFGKVKVSLAPGRVVAANDLWIAACAIRHSIPLLTHNRKHFEGIPRLRLLS